MDAVIIIVAVFFLGMICGMILADLIQREIKQ